jgi:hypothetical protein
VAQDRCTGKERRSDMAKYYGVEWEASIAGNAEIEAESEADAISIFKASPEEYTEDRHERPYEFDHKVGRVKFICEYDEDEEEE